MKPFPCRYPQCPPNPAHPALWGTAAVTSPEGTQCLQSTRRLLGPNPSDWLLAASAQLVSKPPLPGACMGVSRDFGRKGKRSESIHSLVRA